jgi:hypothetical protein
MVMTAFFLGYLSAIRVPSVIGVVMVIMII